MECVKIFLSLLELFENEKTSEDEWIFKYGDMIVNSILIQGYIESSDEKTISVNDGTSTLKVLKDENSFKNYQDGGYYQLNIILEKDISGNFIASIAHSLDLTSKPEKDRELFWLYQVLHIHYKVYKNIVNLKDFDKSLKNIKEKKLSSINISSSDNGIVNTNTSENGDPSLIEITDDSIHQEVEEKNEDKEYEVKFEISEDFGDYELPDDNNNNDDNNHSSNLDPRNDYENPFDLDQEDISIEYELLEEESKLNNDGNKNKLNSTINLNDEEVSGYADINESKYDDLVFNDEDYGEGDFNVSYNIKNDNQNESGPKDKDVPPEFDDFETKSDDSWN